MGARTLKEIQRFKHPRIYKEMSTLSALSHRNKRSRVVVPRMHGAWLRKEYKFCPKFGTPSLLAPGPIEMVTILSAIFFGFFGLKKLLLSLPFQAIQNGYMILL